jgi:hypothetical protein
MYIQGLDFCKILLRILMLHFIYKNEFSKLIDERLRSS